MGAFDDLIPSGAAAGGRQGGGVMDKASRLQLQSTGLPVLRPEADPFARMTDPKQREMAKRQMMAKGDADIAKDSDTVAGARTKLAQLGEFDELNSRGITGGFGGWLQSKMPPFAQSADAQRMEQLSLGLARGNRIPGEGTISDFDAKQFLKMTGGLDKDDTTNVKFSSAAKMVERAKIDRQAFREAFLAANSTLVGADRMWTQYANAEPIFGADGAPRQGRKSWDSYFAGRANNALSGKPVDKPKASNAPKLGAVVKGYRFKGGNPALPASWEKQ